MPAKGKTNASRVQVGDRILVRVTEAGTYVSDTKTGEGVQVARVTGKGQGGNVTRYGTVSRRMTYNVETSAGTLENLAPIQTMWLAPEDPAGIKRAEKEAHAEEEERQKRADLKAASTEELEATLTDCSPSLAVMVREELANRRHAENTARLERAQQYAVELTSQVSAQEMPETPVHLIQEDAEELLAGLENVLQPLRRELEEGIRPEPTPEDLSDLTASLAAEDLEHVHPDETRPDPADPPAVTMDVVTIHKGDRLYEVLQLDDMSALDGLARVAPCDPEDRRDPFWVGLDLLHVRLPVANVYTEEITGRVRQTREVFEMPDRSLRIIRMIHMDGRRLPVATLVEPPPGLRVAKPEARLRAGEAVRVDDRCFRVLDLEGDGTLTLEPARWRARLEPTGA